MSHPVFRIDLNYVIYLKTQWQTQNISDVNKNKQFAFPSVITYKLESEPTS